MTELFLKLFNLSITAGWIVAAVLVLRPLLRKAPKWIHCILWAIVALRLVFPFTFESSLSLIPSPEVIPRDITTSQAPAIHSGIPALNNAVNPLFTSVVPTGPDWRGTFLLCAAAFWGAGVLVLLFYSFITWLRLRRQVRIRLPWKDNIYFCDDIDSPFILGVFRPRIYIPSGLSPEYLQYVLAHERAHLYRRDHLWKPLGFLLLTLYWFNPLLWVAYILLCKDIEQACDEKVVRDLDLSGKKNYSKALLACSVRRRMVMACPVAFGEVSVKTRIRDVLRYKKPRFWIILGAVALCVLTAVCFLTDPVPCDHAYISTTARAATCTQRGVDTMTCTLCRHSYTAYTPKLEHSYDAGTVTVKPTCTEKGTMIRSCTGCGRERREALAELGHTPGATRLAQAPTCASTGLEETLCVLCEQVCRTLVLEPSQEHILVEEVLREATCAALGEGVLRCQLCDYTESVGYPMKEHTYKEVGWSPATCTDTGTVTSLCTECGDLHREFTPRRTEHYWTSFGFGMHCLFCGAYTSTMTSSSDDDLPQPYSPKDQWGDPLDFPAIGIFP